MRTVITTDKQAFEFIRQNLLDQGMKSIDVYNETCSYRSISEGRLEEVYEKIYGKQIFEINLQDLTEDEYDTISNLALNQNNFDLKCAVGHIIKDEYYNILIEGNPVDSNDVLDLVKDSNPDWKIDHQSLNLLKGLQRIHDHYEFTHWELIFKEFENQFDLDGHYIEEDNEILFDRAHEKFKQLS